MTNFWNNKRVFITGATGLVGYWLSKALLEKNAHLVLLIRDFDPRSELIRSGLYKYASCISGCLEDYPTLDRAINENEIDTVFHLGAQAIVGVAYRSPLATFESNIRGSYNLLEACRVHRELVKRIVVASSDKAYGSSDILPYTEEMAPLGRHPYDVSKSCTDLIAQSYVNSYGLPVAIARCGNIYGGGDLNWSRLIPGTILSVSKGQQPIIRSDGTFTRDYIYVKDVIRAYLMMAENLCRPEVVGEAFNFAPAVPYTALEVVELIIKLLNISNVSPLILNEAKCEIKHQFLCSKKARKILGWMPEFKLEDGLKETFKWYLSYLTGSRIENMNFNFDQFSMNLNEHSMTNIN